MICITYCTIFKLIFNNKIPLKYILLLVYVYKMFFKSYNCETKIYIHVFAYSIYKRKILM